MKLPVDSKCILLLLEISSSLSITIPGAAVALTHQGNVLGDHVCAVCLCEASNVCTLKCRYEHL